MTVHRATATGATAAPASGSSGRRAGTLSAPCWRRVTVGEPATEPAQASFMAADGDAVATERVEMTEQDWPALGPRAS